MRAETRDATLAPGQAPGQRPSEGDHDQGDQVGDQDGPAAHDGDARGPGDDARREQYQQGPDDQPMDDLAQIGEGGGDQAPPAPPVEAVPAEDGDDDGDVHDVRQSAGPPAGREHLPQHEGDADGDRVTEDEEQQRLGGAPPEA
jgi:hypothetical protein